MEVNRRHLTMAFLFVLAALPMKADAQTSTESYTYDTLGRLVVANTTGGSNNAEAHSICYDQSGNRTQYDSKSDGTSAICTDLGAAMSAASRTAATAGTVSDLLPILPSRPLTAQTDFASGVCLNKLTVNLTANDFDQDNQYPLTLSAISKSGGGSATAALVSPSSVSVTFGASGDTTDFVYTVANSVGVTTTGEFKASTPLC